MSVLEDAGGMNGCWNMEPVSKVLIYKIITGRLFS